MGIALSTWVLRLGLVGLALMGGSVSAQGVLVVSFNPQPSRILKVTDSFQQSLLHADHPAQSMQRQPDGTWWFRIRSNLPFDRLLHTVVIIETPEGTAVVTPSAVFTNIDWNGHRIYLPPLPLRR